MTLITVANTCPWQIPTGLLISKFKLEFPRLVTTTTTFPPKQTMGFTKTDLLNPASPGAVLNK